MTSTDERLDQLIDAVNVADRRLIVALTGDEPELASLYATMRRLRQLRQPVSPVSHTPAAAPGFARRAASSLAATRSIAATVGVIFIVGIGVALALANAPVGRGNGGAAPTPPAASPAPALGHVPPPSAQPPSQAWSASIQSLTTLKVGGTVALRPLVTGGYEADVLVYGIDRGLPRPLTLGLAQGDCRAPGQPRGATWLRQATSQGTLTTFAIAPAWLERPLALVVWAESDAVPLACADLPVAAVRRLQPVIGSPDTGAAIRAEPGWQITGRANLAETAGDDFALFVAVTGPDSELRRENGGARLLWFLYQGSCAAIRSRQTGQGAVLYKENPGVERPDRQDFTFIVEREWVAGPLALAAFGEGGGPLIACGDLPTVARP